MFENPIIPNPFKRYQVSRDEFDLYEGEIINPGREIGIDINFGISIHADYWGRVTAIYHNPMNDSFTVTIFQEYADEIAICPGVVEPELSDSYYFPIVS